MLVNGYEIEKAPNGAWWVRQAQGRQAWRFADRAAALRFARQRRPLAETSDQPSPTPLQHRVGLDPRRRA
jgi:hypothetical protein